MINIVTQTLLLAVVVAPAGDNVKRPEAVDVTIVLRGADTDADVEVLIKALRSTKGVKVISDGVEKGFRKFNNRFTTPIVVAVAPVPGDDDVNVGALAAAVSKAKTRNRDKYPPGVNLLLFTNDTLDESSISALRSSLSKVNGVEVDKPGGLGGSLQDRWCWIQLENAGGAMLKEIEKQARTSGKEYRRLKDGQQQ
jgi:hypothetical protein